MNKELYITINNFNDTSIRTSQWHIIGEPERISIKFGNKEYITVLDSPPYFEIWDLDEKGEMLTPEQIIHPALITALNQ